MKQSSRVDISNEISAASTRKRLPVLRSSRCCATTALLVFSLPTSTPANAFTVLLRRATRTIRALSTQLAVAFGATACLYETAVGSCRKPLNIKNPQHSYHRRVSSVASPDVCKGFLVVIQISSKGPSAEPHPLTGGQS